MAFEVLKVTKVIRWFIPEFSLKKDNGTSTKSNIATFSYDQNVTSWYMTLYPNGNKEEQKEHVSLFLNLESAKSKEFVAQWSFTLQCENGFEVKQLSEESKGQDLAVGRGFGKFISHQKFSKHFKGCSSVTIICELSIYGPQQKPEIKSNVNIVPSIHHDFKKMFEEKLLCDLDIKTNDGVTLKAHKNILAARSPVFLEMLTTDIETVKTNSMVIRDFDSETIRELLRFIYCEEVKNLGKIAKQLIYAAEEFQVIKLKEKCIIEIAAKLTKENVIEALIIADYISGTEKLIKACVPIVSFYFIQLSKDPKWKTFSKDMLHMLIAEIWSISNTYDVSAL